MLLQKSVEPLRLASGACPCAVKEHENMRRAGQHIGVGTPPGHCHLVADRSAEIRRRQSERHRTRLLQLLLLLLLLRLLLLQCHLLLLPELLRLVCRHAAIPARLRREPSLIAPLRMLHVMHLLRGVLPTSCDTRLSVARVHSILLLLLRRPSVGGAWVLKPRLLRAVLMLLVPRLAVLLLICRLLPGMLTGGGHLLLLLGRHLLMEMGVRLLLAVPGCSGRRVTSALLLRRWRRLSLRDRRAALHSGQAAP